MIIESLRLHPFAGTEDRLITFSAGLNVVTGPNEAGKSTAFHALLHALLTSTGLTPAPFAAAIGRFLPATEGDTVRVSVELSTAAGRFSIEKVWTAGNRKGISRLVTPAGAELTGTADVDERLAALLPAGPASVREVLLTGQAALVSLKESLDPGPAVRGEIGDILRRGLMQAGGVSIDRFRTLLDDRHGQTFRNWDAAVNRPASGREIDNPHRKNLGTILKTYYEMSRLEGQHRKAVEAETAIDELNALIRTAQESIESAESQRARLFPLRDSIRLRQESESELRALRAEIETVQKIVKDWPAKEERLRSLNAERERTGKTLALLSEEKRAAQNQNVARELMRRVNFVRPLKKEAERTAAALSLLRPVTDEDLARMNVLRDRVRHDRATLEASRLTLSVEATKETTMLVRDGSTAAEKVSVKPGATHRRAARGRLEVEVADISLAVWAGDETGGLSLEEVARDLADAEAEISKNLSQFGVEDAGALDELAREYYRASQQAQLSAAQLQEALGTDDFAELTARAQKMQPDAAVRPIESVVGEIAAATHRLDSVGSDITQLDEELADYVHRFGAHESLVLAVGRKAARIEELVKDSAALPALPKEFDSAASFFSHLDALDQQLRDERAHLSGLMQDRARAEAGLPEESSEQLALAAGHARALYQRVRREAGALDLVKRIAASILEEVDSGTFTEYTLRFAEYLKRLSGGRFVSAEMNEGVPGNFTGSSTVKLPFDRLSWGTRDVVALALRLVLAEYLLRGKPGFLVLDDPFVDMDPQRRNFAAATVREFSTRHQTIVFTCHPQHADDLGGVRIELHGPDSGAVDA
ncbi:MAG TPA: AAA family ATPase [Spirochaetia bacterium]|nr:AAA family ATPase [Spirochaetia bacterium]